MMLSLPMLDGAPGVALRFDGALPGDDVRVVRTELWQAIDRPDRFEIELCATDRDALRAVLDALAPGRPVQVGSAEGPLARAPLAFRGVVARRALRVERGVTIGSCVAWPAWQESRRHLASQEDCYYHMTDAEIATRIAGELAIAARIEATSDVHERVERRGDPLRLLRRCADRAGRVLAIAADTMWFVRALPPSIELTGSAPRGLTLEDDLLGFATEDRGAAGRCGRFDVPLDGGWRPLLEVDIAATEASWNGRSRVVRCVHTIAADGARTRVEFVQERADGSLPVLDSGPDMGEVSHADSE